MIRTSVAARNAELDALGSFCDGGSVKIYSGKRPSSLESDAAGELLAECRLDSPAFKPAKSGSIRANEIMPERSATLGKAGWFQVVSSPGDLVWDGDCTKRGQGGACELDHTDIQAGSDVTITSLVYTLPE